MSTATKFQVGARVYNMRADAWGTVVEPSRRYPPAADSTAVQYDDDHEDTTWNTPTDWLIEG